MNRSAPKVCWDSNCFIAYLAEEAGRFAACEAVLEMAERGEIHLYASFMALVETVRVPHMDIDESDDAVRMLFANEYVRNIDLGLEIAVNARRLQQVANIGARDAVHLAIALQIEADALHTYDRDLPPLDCAALGIPIAIEEPRASV